MTLFKKYRKYARNNPRGLWFKRRPFGWGWVPVKWQGWAVVGVYIAAVSAFALTIDESSPPREVAFTFILPITFLTLALLRICYAKGEKPKWSWGFPDDTDTSVSPQTVLHFWFTECTPKDWFSKNDEFDAKIRARFEATYHSIVKGETRAWRATPEGRLAEIIVLDQFSRNMFRGTAKAFANDPLALKLSEEAVETGDDMKLEPKKRHFLYMPYMHSESKEAHERGLKLFEALGEAETLKYEIEHKAIIDRFGRYPHRNEVLGRTSTPEEVAFLKTHKGF